MFKQSTAYELRISDWSSDVCSSDLVVPKLGFDVFGARLKNVDLAVDAVAAPFDIHGALVVLFDNDRVARQLDDLVVGQRIEIALRDRHIDRAYRQARRALRVELHLDALRAAAPADDGIMARCQSRMEYIRNGRVGSAMTSTLEKTDRGESI